MHAIAKSNFELGVGSTEKAVAYIEEQEKNMKDLIKSSTFDLGIEKKEDNILILDPFVIYDLDREEQEKKYYFPVTWECSDQIIAVVCLLDTTVGWQYTIGTDWVEELNSINYKDQDYIFYIDNGTLVAQNKVKKKVLFGKQMENDFDEKTVEAKKEIISNKFKRAKRIDVEENGKRKEKN